jgi:YVTN family beta-propeller protein
MTSSFRWIALLAAGASLAGCDSGGDDPGDGGTGSAAPVLARPSKSGTVAITGNDKFVAMVNPETGSVSVFDTATDARIANVRTGAEPSSIVIGPDDDTAYVANRAAATVVKITKLSSAPAAGAAVDVGAEPTGVALSPTGKRLFVAEFAEGRVSVIDTDTMKVVATIDGPDHPKALAVTNNGDASDADELLVVPEFFGEPTGTEGADTSRTGRVRLYKLSDLSPAGSITLAPIASGFAPTDATGAVVGPVTQTSANQLASAIVVGGKLYATTVSASPAPPFKFNVNVQPVLEVIDLQTKQQDTGVLGTMNLAKLVKDQVPDPKTTPGAGPRNFLADLIDVGFAGSDVAYVLSQGGDAIQRVVLTSAGPRLGSDAVKQIDIGVAPAGSALACQDPTGLAVAHLAARAYVNCWVTRSLGVVDLASQALVKTVVSDAIAEGEKDVQAGKRFYFTARGRWSNESWEACGSCHPDGLTDNITWIFPTGPRQTISMDGTFSHAASKAQSQRVLNWTAQFEEIHDFERNTRAVSGGLGAITEGNCNAPDEKARPLAIDGFRTGKSTATGTDLALASAKELQDQPGGCNKDWDQIEAFVKTIRPSRGLRGLDPASVARGAALFARAGTGGADPNAAGCVACHGGAGWTVSRTFYRATAKRTDELAATAFQPPATFPSAVAAGTLAWSFQTLQIAIQPASSLFDADEATTAIGPNQLACVLRNLGTFGVPGDDAATKALELKNDATKPSFVARAQGRLGYNVPSLYGMALGAPYLHHGGARTLAELFDDPKWRSHAEAGSAVWLHQGSTDDIAARKRDLVNFLLAIDATTAIQDVPAGFDACPASEL